MQLFGNAVELPIYAVPSTLSKLFHEKTGLPIDAYFSGTKINGFWKMFLVFVHKICYSARSIHG
jgi:hypothetical protein